ncbi:MYND-type domain-containing protein [Mycena kentingensis (nom. inval.)]|nr:MYND-type domain-containing protein [Mycena kentingensis (nom. inval.)]
MDTTERSILKDFMYYTGKAFLSARVDDLIPAWTTEEFLFMAFRAWDLSLGFYVEKDDHKFLTHVSVLIPTKYTRKQADEAIDGGGTLDKLARLLTRNLALTTPLLYDNPKHEFAGMFTSNTYRSCTTILGIDKVIGVGDVPDEDCCPLLHAVMRHEGVKLLTQAFCALTDSKRTSGSAPGGGVWEEVTSRVLNLIHVTFFMGSQHVAPAMDAGFLKGVAACAEGKMSEEILSALDLVLADTLSEMTIFLDAHDSIVRALDAVDRERLHATEKSKLLMPFMAFAGTVELSQTAMKVYNERKSETLIVYSAGLWQLGIGSNDARDANLGTTAAQSVSGSLGMQVAIAAPVPTRRTHDERIENSSLDGNSTSSGSSSPSSTTRSTATKREPWCTAPPAALLASPTTKRGTVPVPVTSYPFRSFSISPRSRQSGEGMQTRPAGTVRPEVIRDDRTFDEWVSRAWRANGRISVHVVRFRVGLRQRWVVIPLRMNMSFMEDAAARLVKELRLQRPLEDEGEFQRLAQAFSERVEVPGKFKAIY